jgi:hypothetical protein
MIKSVIVVILMVFTSTLSAQYLTQHDRKVLQKKEDSLKQYAIKIIQDTLSAERLKADSIFTRMFVRALKTPHSISYPFDSLITISKLCPPDSSFRIYTWQLVINEGVTRQHGAIQMRTTDGSLQLFPLIDKSDVTRNTSDTIGNNKGWIGAVYYNMITKKSGLSTIYTLLGYDENRSLSTKKIVEILTFSNGEPVFGNRIFSYEEDSVFKPSRSRYVMEFKKGAGARLTYDKDLDLIIAEHLVSETNEPEKKWTYIPDGDYEGFKWKNGKWIHVEKVFNYVTPEGEAPVPSPIRGNNGEIDENKLQITEMEETEPTKPAAETPKPVTDVVKPDVTKPKPNVPKKPAPVKKKGKT